MLLKDIYNFLKKFSNIISDEHKDKLINIQSHLEYVNNMKLIKNKNGEHYADCVWANEETTCGPDTCQCSFYNFTKKKAEEEVKQIINLYNLIKCKNCTFSK